MSGFKDREITTTLDSGDKELSFSYPAAGALVDLLKEEYYIQSNFSSDEEYISFLNTIKNRSTYKYDVNIYVERNSQKGIVIGKDGKLLKEIGTEARKDIERLLDRTIYLNLWVKVKDKWRKKKPFLKEMGYFMDEE